MKHVLIGVMVCCVATQINGMELKKQSLTPEQIEYQRKYWCTSLVELCYSKMVYSYKNFLIHIGDDKIIPYDIKEGVIERLVRPGVISVSSIQKNLFFSKYIAAYKKLYPRYCRSIVEKSEKYVNKLQSLQAIGEALCEAEPNFKFKSHANYLKRHLGGNTKLYTFDTGEKVLNLDNSHIYIFNKNCHLIYAVGSLHTKLTAVKCEKMGQRKCVLIGDASGRIYVVTTKEGGFSAAQLSGSIVDFVISSDSEDRVAVHYKQGQDKKVVLLRANETSFSNWFIGSRIHQVEEDKVEKIKFAKNNGQLVTYSPKGERHWDFVCDASGQRVVQEIT